MNIFDGAFQLAATALQEIAGRTVEIDGQTVTAVVSVVEMSKGHIPGVSINDNQASIFLTADDYTTLGGRSLRGKLVSVDGDQMRIVLINRMHGAGAELVCERVEQRQSIPRL